MNKPIFVLAFTIVCLFSVSSAMAESPVWQITKGDKTMYIGGTIHMLVAADYPLPDSFDAAYKASETIVFETDIAALQTPEVQQKMMGMLTYIDGKTLLDDISPETYASLGEYTAERGIPVDSLLNLKPGMLVSMLTIIELQRLGLMGTGVDEFFNLKAKQDQKTLAQLESVDEQIQFIADMGKGEEDQLIAYTLRDMGQLSEMFSKMKTAWRSGDMKALGDLAIVPMKSDFPALFKLILADRNNDWMPDIESMMNTPEIEFVLVGALHLAGEVGVLEQLRRKGYTVKKM